MDSEKAHISHSVFISAEPTRVFTVITEANEWNRWFTKASTIDLRIGGHVALKWRSWGPDRIDADDGGKIVAIEKDRRFAFEWDPTGSPTTVEFALEPQGAGTRLTVTDSGWLLNVKTIEMYMGCATGWGEALTLIKFYVELGATYGEVPVASKPIERG